MPARINILPERPRKYRFALTPLADAIFQLLIFFMLTSNLTAYSLLPVQTAPNATVPVPEGISAGNTAGPGLAQPDTQTNPQAVWTIAAQNLVVGHARFDFDQLEILAEALLVDNKDVEVILIVDPTARVQDLATVLSRLKAAGVAHVKLSQES